MALRIVCSGYLVRHPVGGHSLHQLQYLVGLSRLGHEVTFFEHYGWPSSCYDPSRAVRTADPSYGISYLTTLLRAHGLEASWCYLAEDGTAYGMSREELGSLLAECDLYLNLDNINWIDELERCRRRVLIDADPVFAQIGAFGLGGSFSRYHALFTFGENVHKNGSRMPTGGARWLPTRQPVVLDLWPVSEGDPSAPITTVVNWSAYGDREHNGRTYGQKDREFERFHSLPRETGELMEIAASGVPADARRRLERGGWRVVDAVGVSRDAPSYQRYLAASRAEFCVAKHAYVTTRCGWFSDRSAGYLAAGRPVVVQDTGFTDFLPTGAGLLAFRTRREAGAALERLHDDYAEHGRAARALAEDHFDSDRVLGTLLERSL